MDIWDNITNVSTWKEPFKPLTSEELRILAKNINMEKVPTNFYNKFKKNKDDIETVIVAEFREPEKYFLPPKTKEFRKKSKKNTPKRKLVHTLKN